MGIVPFGFPGLKYGHFFWETDIEMIVVAFKSHAVTGTKQ
jgi:hypothetical protein